MTNLAQNLIGPRSPLGCPAAGRGRLATSCWLLLTLAAAPAWSAPADSDPGAPLGSEAATLQAEADAAFRRGEALWQQQRREEALREFERAYEISPAFEVLYFIGAVSVELQRWARARRAFELYLQLGAERVGPEQLAAVRQHLQILNERTATLSLTVNVADAEVHVNGARLTSTSISGLIVEPGEHTVRVSKPGFQPVEQKVHAADGENVHLVVPLARLGLEPLPAPAMGARRAPSLDVPADTDRLWLPWAITSALGASWLTTALLAVKARHDRDTIEQPGVSAGRIDAARRLHVALAVASDVLLLSTLASGGVSAYLTWWQPEPALAEGARDAAAGPTPHGWAVHFSGRF